MLVLTITKEEPIHIICPDGTKLTIHKNSSSGSRTSLAFDAPKEYRIVRDKVLQEEKNQ